MTIRGTALNIRALIQGSPLLQIGALIGIWWLGNEVVALTHLPIPGAIVAMGVLLSLLLTRCIGLNSVHRGARWLLAEMLLFFVPAVLAILKHPELIGARGLKVFAVIATGTLTVMLVTASVVDLFIRLMPSHEAPVAELD